MIFVRIIANLSLIHISLVERVQQGDKKAFNLLVSRYQNKVAGLLTRYISHNDIPDVRCV